MQRFVLIALAAVAILVMTWQDHRRIEVQESAKLRIQDQTRLNKLTKPNVTPDSYLYKAVFDTANTFLAQPILHPHQFMLPDA